MLVALQSGRVWLAAFVALLAAYAGTFALTKALEDVVWPFLALQHFTAAFGLRASEWLITATFVEACKLAAVVWVLRRNTEEWAVLGIAYGLMAACVELLTVAWRPDALGPLTVLLPIVLPLRIVQLVLLHAALGRLGTGLARKPSGLVAAFCGVAAAHFLVGHGQSLVLILLQGIQSALGTLFALMSVVRLPELLLALVFAFVVWRVVPWPRPGDVHPNRALSST